eukprot:jgi/Botrbrau1/19373/Bobra.0338s0007.1
MGATAMSPPMPAPDSVPSGQPMDEDDDSGGFQGTTVGTCELMCPVEDRERRERTENISMFERPDPRIAKSSPDLAVKPFQRTVDPGPDNFRTMAALQRTQRHLRAIMDRTDGFKDKVAVAMIEEHIRFMILAQHELSEVGEGVADKEAFNAHLNIEQVNKAIVTLCAVYDDAAKAGEPYPTEGEIRSYNLLLIMGTHGKYAYIAAAYTSALLELRPELMNDPNIKRALALHEALRSNNFVRFFRLAAEAPYLQSCLAHVHFPKARATALRMLSSACNQGVPVSYIAKGMLFADKAAAARFCEAAGLEVIDNLVMVPRNFQVSHKDVPQMRSPIITQKAAARRSIDSLGGTASDTWAQAVALPLPQPTPEPVQERPAIGVAPPAFVPPAFGSALQQGAAFFPSPTPAVALPMRPATAVDTSVSPLAAAAAAAAEERARIQHEEAQAAARLQEEQRLKAEQEARQAELAAQKALEEEQKRARQEEERVRAEEERRVKLEQERRAQEASPRCAAGGREETKGGRGSSPCRGTRTQQGMPPPCPSSCGYRLGSVYSCASGSSPYNTVRTRREEETKAEAARKAAAEEEAERRRILLEAAQRRAAEEQHRMKVAEFTERREKRVEQARRDRLLARAKAWGDRARSIVSLRDSLRNCTLGLRWGPHPFASDQPTQPSSAKIASLIKAGSKNRLTYKQGQVPQPPINVAAELGPNLSYGSPDASLGFCKLVVLYPPESESALLRNYILGVRGARLDSGSEILQTSIAKCVNSSGRVCQVLATVSDATPLCRLPASDQQEALEKAMGAATGVLVHIPWRRTPDLASVVASLASMLRSRGPAGLLLPVLILTDPSISRSLAAPLAELLSADADLLSAVSASTESPAWGPTAWDLVPGKAIRLESAALVEPEAGSQALVQGLKWLGAMKAPSRPLTVKQWSTVVEELVWNQLLELNGAAQATPADWLTSYNRGVDASLGLLDKTAAFDPQPQFWDPDEGGGLPFIGGPEAASQREACRAATNSLRIAPWKPESGPTSSTHGADTHGAVMRHLEYAGVPVSALWVERRPWQSLLSEVLLHRIRSLADAGLPSIVLPVEDAAPRRPLRLLLGGPNTSMTADRNTQACVWGQPSPSSPAPADLLVGRPDYKSLEARSSAKRKALRAAIGQSPMKEPRRSEDRASPPQPWIPSLPDGQDGEKAPFVLPDTVMQKLELAKREAAAFTARLAALAGESSPPFSSRPILQTDASTGGTHDLLKWADDELEAWAQMLHNLRLSERGI